MLIAHSSSLTGGGEEDFLRLLKYLYGKYKLTGIFPEGGKIEEYKKFTDEYLVIQNQMFPFTKFEIKSYSGYLIKSFSKVRKIRSFVKNKNIDLIYIHSSVCLYEMFSVSKLNIPVILAIREFINPRSIRKVIYKYLFKISYRIIVISKFLELELRKIKKDNTKVILIYPGIEKPDVEISSSKENFIILNIGNIFPQKGQDKVLSAILKLKEIGFEVKLKIIGANVDEAYYRKLVEFVSKYDLKKNVSFTGELPKKDVLKEIAKSSCVVVSSFYEGFSLVFLEAISLKKPLVSTKVGVIPEMIIDGENGLLYDFNDIDLLAEKIKLLINDRRLYEKLSENGFHTFENNFNMNESLSKIGQVFNESIY